MQDETKKLPIISLGQLWWFGWLRGWRANDVTKLKPVGFLVPPWQTTKEILLQPLDDAHDCDDAHHRDDELDDAQDRDDELYDAHHWDDEPDDAHFHDDEVDDAHHCDDELKDTHHRDDERDDGHDSYDDDN